MPLLKKSFSVLRFPRKTVPQVMIQQYLGAKTVGMVGSVTAMLKIIWSLEAPDLWPSSHLGAAYSIDCVLFEDKTTFLLSIPNLLKTCFIGSINQQYFDSGSWDMDHHVPSTARKSDKSI